MGMAAAVLRAVSLAVAAAAPQSTLPRPVLYNASTWPSGMSSAFVQLFEWSWTDIATECEEWLGPKGFAAVQVSPPTDHISGDSWWTRYQPVTYKLVSRSGDEQAFRDMVQRCKRAGVAIYVDAVFNHVAAGSGTSVAGSRYGSRRTPIFSPNDMHHQFWNWDSSGNCGISNYRDKWNVQYCDLEGLPDLCTSCDHVKKTVAAYIKYMEDIGIGGLRIDAAKHMDSGELAELLSLVNPSLFRFQEVISGAGEAVTVDMYFHSGFVTEFNYARWLAPNFIGHGKLWYLNDFGMSWGLMEGSIAVVFIDNHDTQRGDAKLTYRNGKLYELVNIFMLAHPYGYPRLMSSYHFDSRDQGPPKSPVHAMGGGVACSGEPGAGEAGPSASLASRPWVCEHRWTAVANMVGWRRAAGKSGVTSFQAPGGDTIGFCRGSAACVALNRQPSATWHAKLRFTLPPGAYCNIISSDDPASCPNVTVLRDGTTTLEVPPMGAVAVHVRSAIRLDPSDWLSAARFGGRVASRRVLLCAALFTFLILGTEPS